MQSANKHGLNSMLLACDRSPSGTSECSGECDGYPIVVTSENLVGAR